MSNRYKGGIISATPPTTSKASASGAWTLEQQMQAQGADAWPYAGPTYIEDVFSTWLYTGNSSTQTITNGVDLSTYGGLVWLKRRTGIYDHWLWDTSRGAGYSLNTNNTNAQANIGTTEGVSFTTSGFSMGNNINWNESGISNASWTFRKQPKFFDVLTYTGNGVAGRQLSHSLGSVPGCIIVKETGAAGDWRVWHRGLPAISGSSQYQSGLQLHTTVVNGAYNYLSGDPTSTYIPLTSGTINSSGSTYVMYLFAHDAGGFGLNGTDNVISCGSFTTGAGGNVSVTLGYEPQWVLYKLTSAVDSWFIVDNMRGMPVTNSSTNRLLPNATGAEQVNQNAGVRPTATGFDAVALNGSSSGGDYIYIAIRRGPMKVPTTGTSVYTGITITGNGASDRLITGTNAPIDLVFGRDRDRATNWGWYDRLRGAGAWLRSNGTEAEVAATYGVDDFGVMNGFRTDNNFFNTSGYIQIAECFKRAPSFMDVVCYTGTGVARTVAHNLGVVPELFIEKCRNNLSAVQNWSVYAATQGATKAANLNTTGAFTGQTIWSNTAPTASVFSINGGDHSSGDTYVAYLFATLAGVSKVGSYTGNGSSQTIACGFTAGARFILIKRTDSTGDWYVWDTARGIVAGNDPHLSLNTNVAEVTTDDTIDPDNTGFIVNQVAATNVNVTSATYIFLAIA